MIFYTVFCVKRVANCLDIGCKIDARGIAAIESNLHQSNANTHRLIKNSKKKYSFKIYTLYTRLSLFYTDD